MAEVTQPIIRVTSPLRLFKDHADTIFAVAVFPDGRRMVTGAADKTICLWDINDGVMLKRMEVHQDSVIAVAVSRDGQLVASGDENGQLIAWKLEGDTLEPLMQPIKVHSFWVCSLDFSPDGTTLASGAWDKTVELWCTKTWQVQGNPIVCGGDVNCVRYSPSGEFLAIASTDLIIYNPYTKERIATLNTTASPCAYSLAWMSNGARLLSAGAASDPTIRMWDFTTGKQVGDPWMGHTNYIFSIAVNHTGTLVASGCKDGQVRLWRASDGQTIAIYKDIDEVNCSVFSTDGKHILSGGESMIANEWALPEDVLLENIPNEQATSPFRPCSILSTPADMIEAVEVIPRIAAAHRTFKGHKKTVFGIAVFPDGQRMVTTSMDHTLLLLDLKNGVVLKKMEGHQSTAWAVAISGDGKLIASGDEDGAVIGWHGDTGEPLTQLIKVHSNCIRSMDFSPDGTTLASGSWDRTTELWCTKTWGIPGNPINCGGEVNCVQYSPSGEFLAIAGSDVLIYNPHTSECIAALKTATSPWAYTLAWAPDGTRLFSGGTNSDPNVREWDTSTWKQIGKHWSGHTDYVYTISLNHSGTLVASACRDGQVRLWRSSGGRPLAIFKDRSEVYCATFSNDGKHILGGGRTMVINEWIVPEDALSEGPTSEITFSEDDPEEHIINMLQPTSMGDASSEHATSKTSYHSSPSPTASPSHRFPQLSLEEVSEKQVTNEHILSEEALKDEHTLFEDIPEGPTMNKAEDSHPRILALSAAVFDACITGNLTIAEDILTQEIDGDAKNYNSYANRSFLRARKSDWDHALLDALESINIRPSLIGYISKGIALCGKMDFHDAGAAFDMAFMFAGENSRTTHLILLIKAIALFNANQHEQAMLRVHELITVCPDTDTLACRIIEAYFHVHLGINASKQDEAIDHFATAVKGIVFSSASTIHSQYDVFVMLFGWDLKSLWKTANQKWCQALLRAGIITDALESYRHMMNVSDEATTASCLDWSIGFKRDCGALYAVSGDAALAESSYDKAIELYSVAIELDSTTDTIFANRSRAKLGKMLWKEALLDAQKVIKLNPLSYVGYQLKHVALYGAQQYDEAIEAFQIMMSKLDDSPDAQTQELHLQYISLSKAEGDIQKAVDTYLENAPPRLLNTSTGYLCDREAQINTFKSSTEYKRLLLSIIKPTNANPAIQRIPDVVATYFRFAMLSHRWSRKEPLLHDIQGNAVYRLNPVDSVAKLQSFCRATRNYGYRWAWSDTCCIDKYNNLEVQESVNSMFVWYSHSALTIVYLSDVLPSSKPGALARSDWNKRGWTVQEFLAPKTVLFYQKDWTLYLNDHSPNHKESIAIMQELGHATGIDAHALVAFRPGMRGAREKLQWASGRITTLQEDMAYSLFGIFGVHLPVIYGEKKQNALGRLLQEIVARSGDISALEWVGRPSEFNSCLPADISSYKALPNSLPSLSERQIELSITSLRHIVPVDLASKLYNQLDNLSAPRFANCRLRLPCLAFPVTEFRRSHARSQKIIYEVKVNGLHDLSIVTGDRLPSRQTLLLVYPWDRDLLEQPHSADDTQTLQDHVITGVPELSESRASRSRFIKRVRQPVSSLFGSRTGPVDSESHLRALRLIVRLGQPFRAFLLMQQRGGEYRRIASDHDIVAQAQHMISVPKVMDVRTVEIL